MERLARLALNDEGFVFDPATGTSYTVNPTGLLVLRALRDGLEPEAVCERLCETFGAEPAAARRDANAFRKELVRLGLV